MRAVAAVLVVAALWAGRAWAGGVPVQLAVTPKALWTASDAGLRVVDRTSGRVVGTPRSTYPYAMQVVAGGGAVWIASITNGYLSGAVDRVDLRTGRRTTPLRFATRAVYAIAYASGTLWAQFGSPTEQRSSLIARADAAGHRHGLLRLGERPGWIAATDSGLWLTDGTDLQFLGRTSNRIVRVARLVVTGPLAAGRGGVWVIAGKRILRFSERTKRESAQIRVPGAPILLAAGGARLWAVTMHNDRSRLFEIARGAVVRSRPLPFVPSDMKFAGGRLWLGATAPPAVFELDPRSLRTMRRVPLVP